MKSFLTSHWSFVTTLAAVVLSAGVLVGKVDGLDTRVGRIETLLMTKTVVTK